MADLLPILYQQIVEMTNPSCLNGTAECSKFRSNTYRCCERRYCEVARNWAKEKYDIDLQETGNPDLPFMGAAGCTVLPHLRPICALHVCTWSWAPVGHVEHDIQKTQIYNDLYEKTLTEAKNQNKDPFECPLP